MTGVLEDFIGDADAVLGDEDDDAEWGVEASEGETLIYGIPNEFLFSIPKIGNGRRTLRSGIGGPDADSRFLPPLTWLEGSTSLEEEGLLRGTNVFTAPIIENSGISGEGARPPPAPPKTKPGESILRLWPDRRGNGRGVRRSSCGERKII